jgi:hypothetical protein
MYSSRTDCPQHQVKNKAEHRRHKAIEKENISLSYALPCERTVVVVLPDAKVAVFAVICVFLANSATVRTGSHSGFGRS